MHARTAAPRQALQTPRHGPPAHTDTRTRTHTHTLTEPRQSGDLLHVTNAVLVSSAVFGRLGACVWYFADLQSCHRNSGAPGFRTLSASHSEQQQSPAKQQPAQRQCVQGSDNNDRLRNKLKSKTSPLDSLRENRLLSRHSRPDESKSLQHGEVLLHAV